MDQQGKEETVEAEQPKSSDGFQTEIVPTKVQGELRALDLDLARRLDYGRPRKIRELIKRYDAAIRELGAVVWLDEIGAPHGGAPCLADDEDGKCRYLNREQ